MIKKKIKNSKGVFSCRGISKKPRTVVTVEEIAHIIDKPSISEVNHEGRRVLLDNWSVVGKTYLAQAIVDYLNKK